MLCLLPLQKKQPATTEPSISRSRLRHWLAPPLRHPSLGRSSKPLPILIFVPRQCIVGGGFAQTSIGRLCARSTRLEPATSSFGFCQVELPAEKFCDRRAV